MSKTGSTGKADTSRTDGMLQEWGARLFYPALRGKKTAPSDLLAHSVLAGGPGSSIRAHIRATIAPHGKQVMVKITGGGRGMKAIQAHMRYISRLGKDIAGGRGQSLELEDENGNRIEGAQALKDLAQDWRMAGGYIDDDSKRREAYNIILSMPEGTPSEAVRDAAREFAHESFQGHKWVMALHTDTRSPHVHLAVRAQRYDGRRLNPRKADLQRWRETFAARLQDRGINALATKARVRGIDRSAQPIWRTKAQQRVQRPRSQHREGPGHTRSRADALAAWRELAAALQQSPRDDDRALAKDVGQYLEQAFAETQRRGNEQRRDQQQQQERQHAQAAQRAEYQRNYGTNSRPDYRSDRAGIRAAQRAAAVSQSNAGAAAGQRPPQSVAGLRNLSGIPLVQDRRGPDLLLHPNAQHRLEQGAAADHDVRRPGPGVDGDAGRVAQPEPASQPAQKQRIDRDRGRGR